MPVQVLGLLGASARVRRDIVSTGSSTALRRALGSAERSLDTVLAKARLWQRIAGAPLNERQVKLLDRLLEGV